MARRITIRIEELQAKMASDPHSPFFAQLADAYRRRRKLEEALRVCGDGISHCPKYAGAYVVLGRIHKDRGDLPAARQAFRQAVRLAPDNVIAHGALGQIAEEQHDLPDALAAYRMALTLYPFDREVREAVARLEAQTGSGAPSVPPEVVGARPEPALPPPEPLATETLAELYAAQGSFDRAADIYARLISEAPDREDLAVKYREATAHLEETGRSRRSVPVGSEGALRLLKAWRETFRRLAGEQRRGIAVLEAWRDAFRRLKTPPREGRAKAARAPRSMPI
jgi:tetratricopeptide (TPR) repeat protein